MKLVTDLLPKRTRGLAIAIGLASLPILYFEGPWFFFVPAMFIIGAVLQRRLPLVGRCVLWVAAVEWSSTIMPLIFFLFAKHKGVLPPNFAAFQLTVILVAVLLAWCDVELFLDGVRIWRSMTPTGLTPVRPATWITAGIINIWVLWGIAHVYGLYEHYYEYVYVAPMLGVYAAIAVVLDVWLVRRTLSVGRSRRPPACS